MFRIGDGFERGDGFGVGVGPGVGFEVEMRVRDGRRSSGRGGGGREDVRELEPGVIGLVHPGHATQDGDGHPAGTWDSHLTWLHIPGPVELTWERASPGSPAHLAAGPPPVLAGAAARTPGGRRHPPLDPLGFLYGHPLTTPTLHDIQPSMTSGAPTSTTPRTEPGATGEDPLALRQRPRRRRDAILKNDTPPRREDLPRTGVP